MVRTVDPAVAVLVGLADHLVDLLVRQLLANRGHDVAQLGSRDEAVVVAVEHLISGTHVSSTSQAAQRMARSCRQTLNASRISSSESVSFILRAIMVRNSTSASQHAYPSLETSPMRGRRPVAHRSPLCCRQGIPRRIPLQRTAKVDGAVVVGIDLVDHVLELRLGRVLAERAHDGAELLGGDLACGMDDASACEFLNKRQYCRPPLLGQRAARHSTNRRACVHNGTGPNSRGNAGEESKRTIAILVLFHATRKQLANHRPSSRGGGCGRGTYKQGKRLLELGDLLFGE